VDEKDLQWVVDELQIRNMISQLALLSDRGDIEEWGTLFADDAHYTTASGAGWHGREAITESGRQRRGKGTHGPGSNNQHFSATVFVRSTGPDTAEAQHYLLMYQDLVPDASDLPEGYPEGEVKRAPTFLVMGYYHDRFRRTSDGWKVSHRELAQSSHSPRWHAEQNKKK
jgi:hypothetical protein